MVHVKMAKPKGQHDGLMYYALSVNAKSVGKLLGGGK